MADIQTLMKKLNLTEAEARELMVADMEIENGKDPFPLTEDQKKVVKQMRQADRKIPTTYKFEKRQRKPNEDKREIIQTLDDALCDLVDNVTVTNIEREIEFVYNDKKYKITLSAPRK